MGWFTLCARRPYLRVLVWLFFFYWTAPTCLVFGGRGLVFSFNKVSLSAKQLIYVSFISIFPALC